MNIKNYALIPFLVALIALALAASAYLFDAPAVAYMYSEQGFFEQASPIIWIIAALFCLWKMFEGGAKYLILGLTFLVLAGREWHMHKAFTSDSILKINFYKDGFGLEQLFGGLAALAIIGLILATLVILIRAIFLNRGYATKGGQLLFMGLSLLVASKIMDRAPAILRGDYNIALDEQFILALLALEEGFEFFCPVLILLGVIYKYRAEKVQPLLP